MIVCKNCRIQMRPLEHRPAFECTSCGAIGTWKSDNWVEAGGDWIDPAIGAVLFVCAVLVVVLAAR